jgi:hypothetical protein
MRYASLTHPTGTVQFALKKRQELGLNIVNSQGDLTNTFAYGEYRLTNPTLSGTRENTISISGRSTSETLPAAEPQLFTDSSGEVIQIPHSGVASSHSEARILGKIARDIRTSGVDPEDATGTIKLFVERKPCQENCEELISNFRTIFPGINLRIIHGPRYIGPSRLGDADGYIQNFTTLQ